MAAEPAETITAIGIEEPELIAGVRILLVVGRTGHPFRTNSGVQAGHEELVIHPIEFITTGEYEPVLADGQAEALPVGDSAGVAIGEVVPVVDDAFIVPCGAEYVASARHTITRTIHHPQRIASVR